jgi:hypothetical protein
MGCGFDVSLISLADQDKYHARNRAGEAGPRARPGHADPPTRRHPDTLSLSLDLSRLTGAPPCS